MNKSDRLKKVESLVQMIIDAETADESARAYMFYTWLNLAKQLVRKKDG